MGNIKYVYPLYERRGVDVNNVEQDIYGAVKSIPKTAAVGIGLLGAWGYSKIKRMMAFRRAKKEIETFGEEFIEQIQKWHALNDNKLENVCANAVSNYKKQVKLLEEEYAQIEQTNSNNPNFQGIPDREKKAKVDSIVEVISGKLKRQIDDYHKGLNAWSTGLLKNYTNDLMTDLVDTKMSNIISKSYKDLEAKDNYEKKHSRFRFTKLSKKQVSEIEGLWLKKIMEINASAGDFTVSRLDDMKQKYFKGKGGISRIGTVFDFDVPKGFMTSEKLNNIKSYIEELTASLRYVDKKLLDSMHADEPKIEQGEEDFDGSGEYDGTQPHPSQQNNVAESHVKDFKSKLYESRDRIKNKR